MRAKPWEEVAVMVRAPPAAEPMTALMARVLALHGDELGADLAVGDHLRVQLHDLGLRRDGVGADHVRVDLAHRLGDGLVAGDCEDRRHSVISHGHSFSSICMTMALVGHSLAQMPQPLQCSRSMPVALLSSTMIEASGQ